MHDTRTNLEVGLVKFVNFLECNTKLTRIYPLLVSLFLSIRLNIIRRVTKIDPNV